MSRDMTRDKLRKLANWWRIYFVWINKLAFHKENKHTLLSTFGMNMYAKFKIKILRNSRLNLGI